MQRLTTLDATRIDITFAEYAMGLLLYDQRALAGVCPLIVGEAAVEPRSGTTVLDNLFHNGVFRELRNALPDTPPAATWAFVRRTLAAAGETLPPEWETMSVRDVMCASARMESGALTSGVLIKDCFFLEGAKDHMRLLLMREFAEKMRRRIGIAAADLNAAAGVAALEAAQRTGVSLTATTKSVDTSSSDAGSGHAAGVGGLGRRSPAAAPFVMVKE